MVKNIVKDVLLLSNKAEKATVDDKYIIQDLVDTLNANKETCVGMAANMIGYNKSIIIVSTGIFPIIMVNPVIISKSDLYKTSESCLSLIGERECIRYNKIEVEYLDNNFNKQKNTFEGFVAQIIQHEIDHTNGIII